MTVSRTKLLHTFQNEHLFFVFQVVKVGGLDEGKKGRGKAVTIPCPRARPPPCPHLLSKVVILFLQQPQLLLQGFQLWAVVPCLSLRGPSKG